MGKQTHGITSKPSESSCEDARVAALRCAFSVEVPFLSALSLSPSFSVSRVLLLFSGQSSSTKIGARLTNSKQQFRTTNKQVQRNTRTNASSAKNSTRRIKSAERKSKRKSSRKGRGTKCLSCEHFPWFR